MAVLRQRVSKRMDDGSFKPVHFETSSEIVMRPDGSSVESTVSKVVDDVTAIESKLSPSGINAAPANHTHTAADVGALPADTVIPSKTSQLVNDSNYTTTATVDAKISAAVADMIDGAPEDYDTFKEVYAQIKAGADAREAINAAIAEKVNKTLTINGKPLTDNINLGASDVGALAAGATAVAATKLATARTFRVDLASTTAASFDGSANAVPGVTGVLPIANGGTGRTDGTVTKLAVARSIRTNLSSKDAVNFDGSANITPGITGTLPVANGGTGVTSITDMKSELGITNWEKYVLEDLA